MNVFKKLLDRLRANSTNLVVLLVSIIIGIGIQVLRHETTRQVNARKTAQVLKFEEAADTWLSRPREVSELTKALDSGKLAAVALVNEHPGLVLYTLKDGTKGSANIPGCSALGCTGPVMDKLAARSVADGFAVLAVDVDTRTGGQHLLDVVDSVSSWVLCIFAFAAGISIVSRLMTRTDGDGAAVVSQRPTTTFEHVIGNTEAKVALERVKAFLQDPSVYEKLGASVPRGVLLVGPPGTGKTMLASALAGESKASFIAVDGSYFTSTYYGTGVAKVKALFKLARKHAPCVLFIDEVDGIGRRAPNAESGGESESNRIINRLLVEMDGFHARDNVIVVAATNHENNLDEAMRRAGRFDTLVRLAKPTQPDRAKLFDLYLGYVQYDGSGDTASFARMTPDLSPADIANIVNKATSRAAELGAEKVSADHVLRAIETQLLGGEVSPVKELLTEATRARLAYHEAGHALVGHWTGAGVVERVTIEPRGDALGVTYMTRETEEPLYGQDELVSRLAMMLGGREAELLVQGKVSSGASDDLKRASELAIQMVGSLGFSETFGLLSVSGIPKDLLGPDIQAAVLREARTMLEQAQETSRRVLNEQRARLDAMAQALLTCEVLAGDDLRSLLGPGLPPITSAPMLAAGLPAPAAGHLLTLEAA